jgi:signal transduction histidine kinase
MSAPIAESQHKTILVVDDVPANIGVLVEALEGNGFRVVVAQDGEEGLMRAQYVRPDLILLDVMMPLMDGFETCRRLKELGDVRDIPVIFMTALTDTAAKVSGFAAGGVDYVTKPFQLEEVLARIHTHLALRQNAQELAAALETLQVAQSELMRKEKLAALGTLVAGVAHELNTPIGNSIMAASSLVEQAHALERDYAEGGGLKRSALETYLQETGAMGDLLMRNLRRAAELITSFKQVAVDQSSWKRRSFSLGQTVAELMTALWPTLERPELTLTQEIPDEIELDSFPGPLGQVLSHLVVNAVRHGLAQQEGGAVTIAARALNEGMVELVVRDNGCGIPPDNLRRIFDPFFTTRLGADGPGLGLSICYNIVTGLLGGRIEVDSKAGAGTGFTLTLPVVAPAAPPSG